MRFEQKFKDYRKAFRQFDLNFDGEIAFNEFVTGLESCGIAMPLEDYRTIYDFLNYDNAEFIDF